MYDREPEGEPEDIDDILWYQEVNRGIEADRERDL
jgi:hypothetical protein